MKSRNVLHKRSSQQRVLFIMVAALLLVGTTCASLQGTSEDVASAPGEQATRDGPGPEGSSLLQDLDLGLDDTLISKGSSESHHHGKGGGGGGQRRGGGGVNWGPAIGGIINSLFSPGGFGGPVEPDPFAQIDRDPLFQNPFGPSGPSDGFPSGGPQERTSMPGQQEPTPTARPGARQLLSSSGGNQQTQPPPSLNNLQQLINTNNRNANNVLNRNPGQGTQVAWLGPAALIGLGIGAYELYQNWGTVKDFWNNIHKTRKETKQWGKDDMEERGKPAIEPLRRIERGFEQSPYIQRRNRAVEGQGEFE